MDLGRARELADDALRTDLDAALRAQTLTLSRLRREVAARLGVREEALRETAHKKALREVLRDAMDVAYRAATGVASAPPPAAGASGAVNAHPNCDRGCRLVPVVAITPTSHEPGFTSSLLDLLVDDKNEHETIAKTLKDPTFWNMWHPDAMPRVSFPDAAAFARWRALARVYDHVNGVALDDAAPLSSLVPSVYAPLAEFARPDSRGELALVRSSYTFGPLPDDDARLVPREPNYAGEPVIVSVHGEEFPGVVSSTFNRASRTLERIYFVDFEEGSGLEGQQHDLTVPEILLGKRKYAAHASQHARAEFPRVAKGRRRKKEKHTRG